MLYSGADLIRTSGQQQDRVAKLTIAAKKEVQPTDQAPKSTLDEETAGALLRFARFIHKDGHRPPPKNSSQKKTAKGKDHPYMKAQAVLQHYYEVGQTIDIYI